MPTPSAHATPSTPSTPTPRAFATSGVRLFALLGLAAAVTLTGCTSSGGGWLGRSRPAPVDPDSRARAIPVEDDAYAALGYRREWRGFPTMSPGARVKFFEVFGDVLAVQESGSFLSLVEAQSGATRWSDQLANPLTRFVGLVRDNGHIISSSETDAYFLNIETGVLADRHRLTRIATTRPLQVDGLLIYGSANGELFAQLRDGGFRIWGNSVRGAVEADPILVGPYAAVVSQMGEVLFFDPVSGSGVSRTRTRGGVRAGDSLAASGTTLFVASLDQSLYAFDARTGETMWRKRTDTPLTTSPTHHDGRVYLDIPGAGLTAFDAATGRQAWANSEIRGRVIGIRRGRLLVWDETTSTAATVDPEAGYTIERVRLSGTIFLRPDRFEDGNLYLASANGVVTKLIPRN